VKPRVLRRNLRIEALFALVAARAAVQLLPASRLLVWAARSPRRPRRFADPDLPRLIAWTVDSVGSWPAINAVCLPRALAAQAMLRRRGIASRLCLGVARDGKLIAAHAWVEIGGDVIIGQTERQMTPIAQLG
jgi:hypothetical protein